MNTKAQTVDTYNQKAVELAKKFDAQGARTHDIERAFALFGKKNPKVLEIGCGNGRDAAEIIARTPFYVGIDISEKLLELAREKVPSGTFVLADVEAYVLPKGLDIIFAFASLIHVPKDSLRTFLNKAFEALNEGGIIWLSMKHSDQYTELTKEDEFGVRTYYLYSESDIQDLAKNFSLVLSERSIIRDQEWLDVILQK